MAEIPVSSQRLEGSERAPARGARRVAAADPNEKLSLTIKVRRRPGAPPLPDQEYWAAHPPGQRQFITREELSTTYGADAADLAAVEVFAQSHGMTVRESHAGKRTVVVDGTVAQANEAFGVDLGRYESPEESYRGREGHVLLPPELVGVVEGVFGLDNRRIVRSHFAATSMQPNQIAAPTLYNFPGGGTAAGAPGVTIGILELGGGYAQADIDAFCLTAKIAAPGTTQPGAGTLTAISVDGAPVTQAGTLASQVRADIEVALDIQVATGTAPQANIALYFAPNSESGFVDGLNRVIYGAETDPFPAVLSISWGSDEANWDSSSLQALDGYLQEAAWLGITVFVASGDQGSNASANDGSAHVIYPASSPWVTSCGGTSIQTKPTFVEQTWNVPGTTSPPVLGAATGGGVSTVFTPEPSWQTGLFLTPSAGPSSKLTSRGVPDVAGFANLGYGIIVYGAGFLIGGTSAVPPLYAGLVTLIVAKVGVRLGYLNPILYQIAATPGQTALRDVSDLISNEWTGPGVTPCPSYISATGWDACTGLGSIDGVALMDALVPRVEERSINPDQPFPFGVGGEWLNWHNNGASDTGEGINAGQLNYAAPDDVTLLTTVCNDNATLAADNMSNGNGVVGIFGRSRGTTWSIGVAGESQTGCGIYGLATGEQAKSRNVVGVAGRSMGGVAVEAEPLEKVVDSPIGVLGQSTHGVGVRGHGGPLLRQPATGTLLPAVQASPGGVFSAGRLQERPLFADSPELVSLDTLAQLRLVPSVGTKLPAQAHVGDLFLVVPGQGDVSVSAQLYLCTSIGPFGSGAIPQWQMVQLGPALPAGTSV